MIFPIALAALLTTAPDCTDEQMTEMTRASDTAYVLTCQPRLDPSVTLTRRLIIESGSDNLALDCQGGTLGRIGVPVAASAPTVMIRSSKIDGRWQPVRNVSIRNCRIYGAVRIWGMGADGSYDELRASSRTADHTRNLQALAPTGINLQNLHITAQGTIPLYIGPGVTGVHLTQSRLDGTTTATAIYLDAESADNRITDNQIVTRTGREMIAIDGSARNLIQNNRLDLHGQPGIYLYRNCGERGVIRHQTPSNNIIRSNSFTGASWLRPRLVVENARNGRRSYCRADAGYLFGSSLDDRDNASGNRIENNRRN